MKLRWWAALGLAPGATATAALVFVVGLTALGGEQQQLPTLPPAGASQAATEEIPPVALQAYQHAAGLCPGLSWAILAGIGHEETGHGTSDGHHLDPASGQDVPAVPPLHSRVLNGALGYAYGPMQFLAGTWATYGPQVAPGANNGDMSGGPVQNINTAAAAAALLLCHAAGGAVTDEPSLHRAIDAYSGSTDGYYDDVVSLAALYAQPAAAPAPPAAATAGAPVPAGSNSGVGLRIVLAAIHEVGIPYADGNPAKGDPGIQYSGHPPDVWVTQHFGAGDSRYSTLDCSGLTDVVFDMAFNLNLDYCSDGYRTDPRFASVAMGALQEGDLVLFGHCGLGVPGHIASVAAYDPTTGLATIIDAARHGTEVGFRPAQNVASWAFTDARRYVG